MIPANAAGGSFCLQPANIRRLAVVSCPYQSKWQEYTHFATFLQRPGCYLVVTPSRSAGTYRHKNQYGVLTIYFSNTKLRDIIVGAITELQKDVMPT